MPISIQSISKACKIALIAGLITMNLPLCAEAQSRITLQNAPAIRVISMPGKLWGVTFDSQGFHSEIDQMKPDGRRYAEFVNDTTKLIISITLENAAPSEKINSCKKVNEDRMHQSPEQATGGQYPGLQKAGARMWEQDGRSILDFMFQPMNQKNRWICFENERVYVDVHISKTPFGETDSPLFDHLSDSVAIHESIPSQFPVAAASTAPSGLSSAQLFGQGSAYYLQSRFKEAIPLYEQALALEKQSRHLRRDYWLVLIDNLGMAYGMTGDLESARKTFQYGIDSAPEFPMFYYNMACYYGEKGDADNAAAFLQKAYDRKANTLANEGIPDPRSDDSFQKLLRDPAFRKRVAEIVGHE